MDIRGLRTFVEVVHQGGFSAAGQVLCASQSAVSKTVKQLEERLGVQLLLRVGHSVRLTEIGAIVYRHANTLLNDRNRLCAAVEEAKNLRCGQLKLGIPPMGGGSLFARLLTDFRSRHPSINIALQEHGAVRLSELVESRDIDIGVLLLPLADRFEGKIVCDEPMMALLPKNHRLAEKKSVRLEELSCDPIILFEKGFALNNLLLAACRKSGFAPQEIARSGQPEFIIALVASGLGVGFLPRLVIENFSSTSLIHTAEVENDDFRWRLCMAHLKGDCLSPSAQAWLDMIDPLN